MVTARRDFPDEIYYGAGTTPALYRPAPLPAGRRGSTTALGMSAAAASPEQLAVGRLHTACARRVARPPVTVLGINEQARGAALAAGRGPFRKCRSPGCRGRQFTHEDRPAYYVLAQSGYDQTPPPAI